MAAQPKHRVSISIAGQRIDGWTEYEIASSMLDAADKFTLKRPFEKSAHRLCEPDSKCEVKIDDVTVLTGYVDTRDKDSDRSTSATTITGRDKVGRLVQESAPTVKYAGELTDVVKQLVDPWFSEVTLSDVRNRLVRLGKRTKAAADNEALVKKVKIKKSWLGNSWRLQPGQARLKVVNELTSEAGYMVWSSADGREIVIGQPDYKQPVQFLVLAPKQGSNSQATALRFSRKESVADRFSLIMALGSGSGDSANYGASTVSRRDVVRNGPGIDGTGLDFTFPKRLILAERSLRNIEEAHALAQRDMDRRDFHKDIVTATMAAHGQIAQGSATAVLYAPNVMSRVIDEEVDLPLDAAYLIFSCIYKCTREGGETTDLQLVPKGTVFAQ